MQPVLEGGVRNGLLLEPSFVLLDVVGVGCERMCLHVPVQVVCYPGGDQIPVVLCVALRSVEGLVLRGLMMRLMVGERNSGDLLNERGYVRNI